MRKSKPEINKKKNDFCHILSFTNYNNTGLDRFKVNFGLSVVSVQLFTICIINFIMKFNFGRVQDKAVHDQNTEEMCKYILNI